MDGYKAVDLTSTRIFHSFLSFTFWMPNLKCVWQLKLLLSCFLWSLKKRFSNSKDQASHRGSLKAITSTNNGQTFVVDRNELCSWAELQVLESKIQPLTPGIAVLLTFIAKSSFALFHVVWGYLDTLWTLRTSRPWKLLEATAPCCWYLCLCYHLALVS